MSNIELDRLQILQKIMEHRMTQVVPHKRLGAMLTLISENQKLLPAATRARPSVLGWLRHVTAVNRLIRQTHDERQGNIQPRNILIV